MIRHIVVFEFKEGASAEERAELLAEIRELPSRYPTMRRFASGENISQRDSAFSHAFSVEFDDEADLIAYLNSDTHEEFVIERFRPRVESRAIVSFEY